MEARLSQIVRACMVPCSSRLDQRGRVPRVAGSDACPTVPDPRTTLHRVCVLDEYATHNRFFFLERRRLGARELRVSG